MGLALSCVLSHVDCVPPSATSNELARALNAGDHITVLSCLRDRPQLLSQRCLPFGNTVWHHIARSGDAQLLVALFALVEQTHDPRNQPWLSALTPQQHQHQHQVGQPRPQQPQRQGFLLQCVSRRNSSPPPAQGSSPTTGTLPLASNLDREQTVRYLSASIPGPQLLAFGHANSADAAAVESPDGSNGASSRGHRAVGAGGGGGSANGDGSNGGSRGGERAASGRPVIVRRCDTPRVGRARSETSTVGIRISGGGGGGVELAGEEEVRDGGGTAVAAFETTFEPSRAVPSPTLSPSAATTSVGRAISTSYMSYAGYSNTSSSSSSNSSSNSNSSSSNEGSLSRTSSMNKNSNAAAGFTDGGGDAVARGATVTAGSGTAAAAAVPASAPAAPWLPPPEALGVELQSRPTVPQRLTTGGDGSATATASNTSTTSATATASATTTSAVGQASTCAPFSCASSHASDSVSVSPLAAAPATSTSAPAITTAPASSSLTPGIQLPASPCPVTVLTSLALEPPRQIPITVLSRNVAAQSVPPHGGGGAATASGMTSSHPDSHSGSDLDLGMHDRRSGGNRSMPRPVQRAPTSYSTAADERRPWLSWRRLSGAGFVRDGGSSSSAGTAAIAQARRPGAAALAAMISSRNSRGQTPLMLACSHGQATIVTLLLRKGADPWIADSRKALTALHYAALLGHYMCAKLLLGLLPSGPTAVPSAASVRLLPNMTTTTTTTTSGGRQWLLEARCRSGATALHLAADLGHTSVVELLLQYGADPTARVTPPPSLPLALLLPTSTAAAAASRWFYPATTAAGATALHLAARSNDMPTALVLLRHFYALLLADCPATDPRVVEDARGRRPHQIAYSNRSYRLAVVLRPDYPPRWLFGMDSGTSSDLDPEQSASEAFGAQFVLGAAAGTAGRLLSSAVPPLATLASAVLRRSLLQQLYALEDKATAQRSADVAADGGGERCGGGGSCEIDVAGKGGGFSVRVCSEGSGGAGGGSGAANVASSLSASTATALSDAVAVAAPVDSAQTATLTRADTARVAATVTVDSAVKAAMAITTTVPPSADAVRDSRKIASHGAAAATEVRRIPPRPSLFSRGSTDLNFSDCDDLSTLPDSVAAASSSSSAAAASPALTGQRSRPSVTHGSIGLPGAIETAPCDADCDCDVPTIHTIAGTSAAVAAVAFVPAPYISDSVLQLGHPVHAGGGVVATSGGVVHFARPASAVLAAATAGAAARCVAVRRPASAASIQSIRRCRTTVAHTFEAGEAAPTPATLACRAGSVRLFDAEIAVPVVSIAAVAAAIAPPPCVAAPPPQAVVAEDAAAGTAQDAAAAATGPRAPRPAAAWGPVMQDGLIDEFAPPYAGTAAAEAALEQSPWSDDVPAAAFGSRDQGDGGAAEALPAPGHVFLPPPGASEELSADHLVPEPHSDVRKLVPALGSRSVPAITSAATAAATAANVAAAAVSEACGICLDDGDQPTVLLSLRGCRHRLCVACARRLVDSAPPRRPATCPFCRGAIAGFALVRQGKQKGNEGGDAVAAALAVPAAASRRTPPIAQLPSTAQPPLTTQQLQRRQRVGPPILSESSPTASSLSLPCEAVQLLPGQPFVTGGGRRSASSAVAP